ncbi:MAG: tetratricopeptide repeat protein [Gammaproteobacteria bacterium]|nr:tetratricopeptide repeat protein [Gammaproteobacteria bacterium]
MTSFLIIAAVMTAVAVALVATPLLKGGRHRAIAVVVAVLMVGGAGGLYETWSNWNWSPAHQAQAPVSPEVAAMVAKLERHLRHDPGDLSGWLMLGRSYIAVGRLDDAIMAFDRALTLSRGKNLDATIGYGEALSLQAGGVITPQAAQLFEQAVTMAPTDPKALLYGGFAAAVRGDSDLARSRWEALIAMHPPAPVVQLLQAKIAQLGPPSTAAATPGMAAATGAAGGPTVSIDVTLAPSLRARLHGPATLYVFAAQPGVRGPPLAVKRLTTAAIGKPIELSSADSMVPGRSFAVGQRVVLTARVSFDGQPTAAAGDLVGESAYQVEPKGKVSLVIDRVEP